MTTLRGAVVVVTGGSSGIGASCAAAFRAAGARVTIVSSDRTRLARAGQAMGVTTRRTDLGDPDQVRALGSWLAERCRPDVIVHAAGIGMAGSSASVDEGAARRLLDVNVVAPLLLTSAVLPLMQERHSGHVVFVGSVAGPLGVARESLYAASKAALGAYALSVAAEMAADGIKVTTVLPGVVDTPFFARRGAAYTRRFPRPIPPARVAAAMVRAVQRDRVEVVVPPWLHVPMVVRAMAPQAYARMSGRWG